MKQENRRFVSSKPKFLISTILLFCLAAGIFGASDNGITPPSDPVKISEWDIVGPSGGDVRVVSIDPKDKDHLFVSTLDGSIHTSTDGGKTWRLLVNLNKPQLVLDQLLIDSRDSKIIYTSGHRHKDPGGFFMTRDGGATWKEAKELRKTSIHSMEQSSKNPDLILVGTTEGMWKSENSGEDWKKIESDTMPDTTIDSIAIDPRDDNTIYAGTWWRAYKTTDGGKSWRLIKNGMIDDSDVFAIEVDQKNPDHVIASACSGIYESFDKGEKWAKMQGIPSQSRRTRDIKMSPVNSKTVYAATTEGFWMTNGKGWMITTQKDLEINSIAVHPDAPERVFIGTNNYGVLVSNDGGRNFTPTNDNFTSRFTYTIIADIEQPNRLYATTHNTATGGGFVFISNDGGTTWMRPKGLDVVRVSPFGMIQERANPNTIYMGTSVGLFKSLDRGNTWTQIVVPKPKVTSKKAPAKKGAAAKTAVKVTKPVPETTATTPAVIPVLEKKIKILAYTEDGKNGYFAGTDEGLYRSYDLTKGWEKVPLGDGISENVFVIYSSPNMPGIIWVGTDKSGVIVSRDDGKTWEKINGIPQDVPISSIVADPKHPQNIYIGTMQTFYISRDGGRSWTRRGGNLPLGNYTSILISPNNSDEIFISSALETDGGIYYSKDAGQNWRRVDSKEMKLPSRRVWSMIFDPSNPSRIFAATHSSGIYRIERDPSTASTEPGTRPRVSTTGN
ncbi:MAG TPA: YCF48-related protein [Pyrinomonadaceae bacterium]|jgi:photosystem II stability/assembly factor-like uncharacterized protein